LKALPGPVLKLKNGSGRAEKKTLDKPPGYAKIKLTREEKPPVTFGQKVDLNNLKKFAPCEFGPSLEEA